MVLYRDLSEGHANSPSKPLMPMPLSVLHDACSQGLLQSAHLSWKAASHPGGSNRKFHKCCPLIIKDINY